MKKIISYTELDGMIKVDCSGRISNVELMEVREKIASFGKKSGIKRVLLDTRNVTALPDTVDLFMFGASFRNDCIYDGMFFALVSQPDHEEHMRFLETVAHNRGTIMKVFTCENSALSWLNN